MKTRTTPTRTTPATPAQDGIVLSPAHARVVCLSINHFGDGCHPYADADTVSGFAWNYARKCARKAIRAAGIPAADRATLREFVELSADFMS